MFNPMALQTEQLSVNYPIDKVYSAVLSAAQGGKFKLKDSNEKLYRISIQTRASAFSWGEILTVQLSPNGNSTFITVSSQQKTWVGSGSTMNQLTIGRKNKRNIDTIIDEISQYL